VRRCRGQARKARNIIPKCKIVRYLIAILAFIAVAGALQAAEITDATGRSVTVPDRVERVVAWRN
jgi:ABC-type Fe3+-hydroxamate transport system substrate-binding protein